MIIKKRSNKKKNEKRKYWHLHFAWKPVRINDDELQWLTKVGRRLTFPEYAMEGDHNSKPPKNKFQYCEKGELLKAKLSGEQWAQETFQQQRKRESYERMSADVSDTKANMAQIQSVGRLFRAPGTTGTTGTTKSTRNL